MLTEIHGDLFTLDIDALAHGVNCMGVMGAGIAVEFKQRWPVMFHRYRTACLNGTLRPGTCLPCAETSPRWIYCLATQPRPGPCAMLPAIEGAVSGMVRHARAANVRRIGMPYIGCGFGGLRWDEVRPIVERASEGIEIVVVEWNR